MRRFVAGLDGGGTKTALTVLDEQGIVVHTESFGAINLNGQNENSIKQSMQEMMETIARVCGSMDSCAQICIGAAGVSNPTVAHRLESYVRESNYHNELLIVGDQETALYGAQERLYGMILIAGTGSICYGKNEAGDAHRAGGFGYLVDDEGSGYSIGRELITAVLRAHDGRSSKTIITELMYEQLQLTNVHQLIGFVYDQQTNKKDIAALAPILSKAVAVHDEAAITIVHKSANALYELVVPVAERLSLQNGILALAGSVLLKNFDVQKAFIEKLKQNYSHMRWIFPKQDASYGAALMALNRIQ